MTDRRTYLALTFAFAIALLTGCAADEDVWESADNEPVVAAEHGAFALLTLASSSLSESDVEVTAQFVRYAGPDDHWARSVLDLWVPEPEANGWEDACRLSLDPFGMDVETTGALPDFSIELLDAGEVSVAAESPEVLRVHSLPDLQLYLSGVVYSLDEGVLPFVPGEEYVFESAGTEQVDAFSVSLEAPTTMVMTAIDGRPRDAFVELALPSGRDLLVEWRAGDDTDRVYIDLYDDARSAAPILSCVAVDDGRFRLPKDALRQVRERFPEAALRLVTRRAEVAEFELAGFSWARAVFETQDAVFLY